MMQRDDCFRVLNQQRGHEVVVVTTMAAAAPWQRISQSNLDFPSVNSAMAHAADFAYGLALAQPQRQVWVLNGDGSMLMSLGTLVTISQTPAPNLVLFVLQNDSYEVTGNQPIPGAGKVSMKQMASGAGFPHVHEFEDSKSLAEQLPKVLNKQGPIFINLRLAAGQESPPNLDRPLSELSAELRTTLQQ